MVSIYMQRRREEKKNLINENQWPIDGHLKSILTKRNRYEEKIPN